MKISDPLVARLEKENPFFGIFEDGCVPVTSLVPVETMLEGVGHERCYFLDLRRITDLQRRHIVAMLHDRSGSPSYEISGSIDPAGLPIRASQIAVPPSVPLSFIL